jgi:hypothetical protein
MRPETGTAPEGAPAPRRPWPARPAPGGRGPLVAVLIPCHNEEPTVGKVIDDFRRELPEALIVVVDNRSTDATAAVAAAHGATVLKEPRSGKGFAIAGMLDRVAADVYVMVDGDDTYPAERVHDLIAPLLAGDAEMTAGARLGQADEGSFRPLHRLGNELVRGLVNWVGDARLTDIMTGYRAMTRRAASRLPIVSSGFEVETELTLQMLYYRLPILEIPVAYRPRPAGSHSKLRTFHDGARVLWTIFTLFRSFKPLTFFGGLALVLLLLGVLVGLAPIHDYLTRPQHVVSHVPSAILATGLVLLSVGCLFLGILLHAINWRLLELHSVITRERDTAAIGRAGRDRRAGADEHAA